MTDRRLLVKTGEDFPVAGDKHLSTFDFGSDFKCFLEHGVSDDDHRRGIRRLWATSTLFGRSDGLDVYCGDYRCGQVDGSDPDSQTIEPATGWERA